MTTGNFTGGIGRGAAGHAAAAVRGGGSLVSMLRGAKGRGLNLAESPGNGNSLRRAIFGSSR
jgi:hypothetical protein